MGEKSSVDSLTCQLNNFIKFGVMNYAVIIVVK